jgi:hypothetical protein
VEALYTASTRHTAFSAVFKRFEVQVEVESRPTLVSQAVMVPDTPLGPMATSYSSVLISISLFTRCEVK